MKTNLANLMSIVDDEEKKYTDYIYDLKKLAFTTSIEELDGKIHVTEDTKSDFDEYFEECKNSQKKITKIKAIIYEKNNTLKLSDGRTIQEAIVDNTNLRKLKSLYSSLLSLRSTKERVTEVHNSYFDCKTLNFDAKALKNELKDIEQKIQTTDFEISKLNSIEFDIEL